jgi:periplasmic divalent cation tolerance protein
MPTDDVVQVAITAPDAGWLSEFVRQLVDDGLAAGAHLTETIRSIYRWRGETHDVTEAHAAIHTVASRVPAIVERANAAHPYEVPCVVSVAVVDGNPAYLDWVRREAAR